MIELIVGLGEWDVSDRNWILWALCYDGWYHYTNHRWTYKWWWRQIISIDIIIDVFNPTIKFDSTLDWFCVKEVSSIWIHCWPITCYIFVWRHFHLYIRDWCSKRIVSWRPRGWRGSKIWNVIWDIRQVYMIEDYISVIRHVSWVSTWCLWVPISFLVYGRMLSHASLCVSFWRDICSSFSKLYLIW